MDAIQRELLEAVSGLHEIPAGAYNIRANGESVERNSTSNIEIIPRKTNPALKFISSREHAARVCIFR